MCAALSKCSFSSMVSEARWRLRVRRSSEGSTWGASTTSFITAYVATPWRSFRSGMNVAATRQTSEACGQTSRIWIPRIGNRPIDICGCRGIACSLFSRICHEIREPAPRLNVPVDCRRSSEIQGQAGPVYPRTRVDRSARLDPPQAGFDRNPYSCPSMIRYSTRANMSPFSSGKV